MIVKELDPFSSTDASARTGHRAEEQIAFYLRRAFADQPNCRVFNGVRLERGNDAAQNEFPDGASSEVSERPAA